jgi:hypothetical protein
MRRSVRACKAPDRYEEEVFCICRKGYRRGDFMIACDECDEWYHGDCVGFEEDVRALSKPRSREPPRRSPPHGCRDLPLRRCPPLVTAPPHTLTRACAELSCPAHAQLPALGWSTNPMGFAFCGSALLVTIPCTCRTAIKLLCMSRTHATATVPGTHQTPGMMLRAREPICEGHWVVVAMHYPTFSPKIVWCSRLNGEWIISSRERVAREQDADELKMYVCASCVSSKSGGKWSPFNLSEDGTEASSGKSLDLADPTVPSVLSLSS